MPSAYHIHKSKRSTPNTHWYPLSSCCGLLWQSVTKAGMQGPIPHAYTGNCWRMLLTDNVGGHFNVIPSADIVG